MFARRDSRLTKIALIVFFVAVLMYAYFESRGILYGPIITVASNLTLVRDPYIEIRGHAEHIASLAMNGREISVTEAGIFTEPFVLAPGDNRILLDAKDKYGRTTQRVVEIVYSPEATVALDPPVSTTTPQN